MTEFWQSNKNGKAAMHTSRGATLHQLASTFVLSLPLSPSQKKCAMGLTLPFFSPLLHSSSTSAPDWCHFCKCFVNPHANSKRMHEQSNNHKKNVETKMREIRKSSQNEAKEEEIAKQMLAGIEARAAEAYKADLAAGARPEDVHGPQLLSVDARLRLGQEAAKRELEEAVERELKVRAEAEYRSQQAKGEWKFDDRSSYYWHAKSSCYFDPKSGMYFNTKANTWSKQAPQVSSQRKLYSIS